MTERATDPGFGVYLHWPFCEAKCPYCDFNSHVTRSINEPRWQAAFETEIARIAALTGPRDVTSIFFGGGTPSLMSPGLVNAVLDAVRKAWTVSDTAEITLEANPRSVEAERFRGFAEAGVNRVSMGLQALDDTALHRLGRLHSVAEAIAAFEVARANFPRVSFDLIYARQDQSLSDWRAELTRALDMGVDHLSLYQLTIEQGTAFWERARAGSLTGLPDEDRAADMYALTQDLCAAHGLPQYEVSNHAKPGAESRHNLIYWRGEDYAGIGPGAHGRLTLGDARIATAQWRNPGAWLDKVESGAGDRIFEPVSPQEQAVEYLMMGLRIPEGVDLDRLHRLDPASAPEDRRAHLIDLGLIEVAGSRLRATADGRLLLNGLIADLLPDAAA